MTAATYQSPYLDVKRETFLALLLLMLQVVFWYGLPTGGGDAKKDAWVGVRNIRPEIGVVPELPSELAVETLSLGDKQFYFRTKTFEIQNAGDTFGRSTALRDYDYDKLYKWWKLLDSLDPRSDFTPSLAGYYYVATQEPKRDIPYVAKYLDEHADHNPVRKWWWYAQSVYNYWHRLDDKKNALRVANKLAAIPQDVKLPVWARQMPAFIHEDLGEFETAARIIADMARNTEDLTPEELNFMAYFAAERVGAMQEYEKALDERRARFGADANMPTKKYLTDEESKAQEHQAPEALDAFKQVPLTPAAP